jgi:hypothetical protein
MEQEERDSLLDDLMERLRTEGVPAGTWLIDLTASRRDLRRIDRRLADLGDELEEALTEARRVACETGLLLERLQAALVREHAREPD